MVQREIDEKIVAVSKNIMSFCISHTNNQYDAEDLAHDIIFEIYKSSTNLRDDSAFYGFMWSIARNVYKQWYRKKLSVKECELTAEMADSIGEWDTAYDDNTDIYCLRRELALLSDNYRRATILYYINNKSCSEISTELSISEGMVKQLLFKSRKILKEGMLMERKLGELSYYPKKLIPMYSGEGPNQFYSFMDNLVRQNVVLSCYNDRQTAEQISLETGIPLPYLDDEIKELTEKKILIKNGRYYSTNIIIISRDCTEEICQKVSDKYTIIATLIREFVDTYMDEYDKMDFYGASFHDTMLRWQLSTIMWRTIRGYAFQDVGNPPVTGWGEYADIWLEEDDGDITKSVFNYCVVDSKDGDTIWFFDYLPAKKGDHHDFYRNQRKINLLCDIAKGNIHNPSEYDLETIAEMIRQGYVKLENEHYYVTMPVYSQALYKKITEKAEQFMVEKIGTTIEAIENISNVVIGEHTPRCLKKSVKRIAGQNRFFHTVCAPAKEMIESQYLNTTYPAMEMPTTYIVLND